MPRMLSRTEKVRDHIAHYTICGECGCTSLPASNKQELQEDVTKAGWLVRDNDLPLCDDCRKELGL